MKEGADRKGVGHKKDYGGKLKKTGRDSKRRRAVPACGDRKEAAKGTIAERDRAGSSPGKG